MSFLYFAYGSNMLTARLTARCPSAKVIGTASVSNHTLEFTKPSTDNSGKATLIAVGDQAIHTPGVLFEIANIDLPKLDSVEGAGNGYDRHDEFEIRLARTDEKVTAMTYLTTKIEARLMPYDWYLALVIAGVRQHELDAEHAQRLRQTEYLIDDNLTRKGRIEALRALAAHGFVDHYALLKRT